MPGIITHKFRLNNAAQFYESLTEAANINTRYYVFLARSHGWASDPSPPTPTDSVQNSDYNIWRNMLATKRVTTSDVTHAAPRYNWGTGTVYIPYTHNNASLYSAQYYVVTDDYKVYKCIDNNNGAQSTVKPTASSTAIFKTSDGYLWKYMYAINASEVLKFVSTNYIPVKTLTANDGSSQWTVQQAAVNGSIDFIKVTANGSGYLATNGTFSAITNSTVVTIASHSSGTDDMYNNSVIYIKSGLGSGQLRRIVNYVGTTKALTVNGQFTTTPNTSSTYYIGPRVLIYGDGSGASAYANVALPALASAGVGNAINGIIILNRGTNYSKFNVVISANSSHGTGATANGSIPPYGGHGSNPVKELPAYNVILNVRIAGTESNTLFTNNDFRVVGLMSNPLLANGSQANSSVYDLTTKLTVTSKSGAFSTDELLSGGTSGAKARYIAFANTNATGTSGVISVTGLDKSFSAAETITGNTSSVTATISSINSRDLKDYSGDILYIENRVPISRASDQTEDIKLISRF
jgi:hypothetical protein